MKKWLILVSIVCLGTAVQASDVDWSADWTRGDYLKKIIQPSRDFSYWSPTEEQLEDRFEELDTDGNGLLSQAERRAVQASYIDWSTDWTKGEYVKKRMQPSKDAPQWKPTKEQLEDRFEKLDTDGDGLLSQTERKAGKKKRRKE